MSKDIVALTTVLESARARVIVGGKYQHVKGGIYTVIDVALREATLEPEVVYRAVAAPDLLWTRPLEEFCERFTLMIE